MNSKKAAQLRPHCPIKVTHGAHKGAVGSVVALNVLEEVADGKKEVADGKKERRLGGLVSGVHGDLIWVSNRNMEAAT